jgi:ComF family protein
MHPRAASLHLRALLRDVLCGALDWIYPRHCCHCEKQIRNARGLILCGECFEDLRARRILGSTCQLCGLPLAGEAAAGTLCMECAAHGRHFDLARAFFPYASPAASVILHFKFHGDFFLGPRFLGGLLKLGWLPADISPPDLVVPVPLHPRRQRERGYDQALLLAQTAARHLGRRLLRGVLVRTRYTSQQSLLPPGGRRDNVHGAFAVTRPDRVGGRSLLLVDDVMTTGATADECARALKKAGAAQVQALSLARAVP